LKNSSEESIKAYKRITILKSMMKILIKSELMLSKVRVLICLILIRLKTIVSCEIALKRKRGKRY
jgi:hypothetical protein